MEPSRIESGKRESPRGSGIEPTMVRDRKDLLRFLAQSLTTDYLTFDNEEIRQASTYIKSYLVEISERDSGSRVEILREQFAQVGSTDDSSIHLLRSHNNTVFFADTFDERFVVLHSIDRTEDTDMAVRRLTEGDEPGFDSSWLPTQFLLNSHIGRLRGFKFSHESLAAGIDWAADLAPEDEPRVSIPSDYRVESSSVQSEDFASISQAPSVERGPARGIAKRAALTIRDSTTAERDYREIHGSKVFQARRSLDWIQYRAVDSDGLDINHNLYSHGKITAKGTSPGLHMLAIDELRRNYSSAIRQIEVTYGLGWAVNHDVSKMTGEPMIVRFSPNIVITDIYGFARSIFRAARPFRLFGYPHRVSEKRLDVEAIDLRTGDSFSVEITLEWMRIYLPVGSCGNVVARLLTNLQHTMDSDTKLFAGDGTQLLTGVARNE